MTIINDPDNLDRFQVAIDPVYKTISVRGSGGATTGGATQSSTGSGLAAGTFSDYTGQFVNVLAGDVLAITDDPGNDGGHIGHYVVQSIDGGNDILTLDRSVTASATSGVSYQVFKPGVTSATDPTLADGVTMQALYSFLKEEWRNNSLAASGEDLIKYTFPMVSITSEQFEVGGVSNSNWEFADDTGDGALASESSRNLIRTGGWASINDQGQIIENYPSVVTLGTVESDSQVYYQQTSATTNPVDFVLTGPVNQSIRTLETIGGITSDGLKTPVNEVNDATVTFAASAPNMTFSSDMFAAGFVSGELIQIRGTASNNGLFTIESSGASATEINVTEAVVAVTETGSVTKASPMTDNRDYLVLRVRTKGKTYAQSEIADIGVSQVNTIVNRFPLAEADDPAITDDDGVLQGGVTGGGNDFQSTSSVETGTTADINDQADGTFTLVDTAATFQANNLQAGDAVSISAATNASNTGVYEVSSVSNETTVVLFDEPLRGATTTEAGAATYEAFSQVRTQQATDGSTADSATGGQGTFTSAGSDFVTDGVVAGDILRVKSGNHQGFYKVVSVTDLNILEVNTLGSNSDTVGIPEDCEVDGTQWAADSSITFDVVQAGMNLQYKEVIGTGNTGDGASSNTITDTGNGFTSANGFYVGATVAVTGTTNSSDGTYLVTGVAVGTLTLQNTDLSASPTFTGTSISCIPSYGFVRKLGSNANGTDFSFNWKLEGNGGDLGECFQFLQRELRRTTDVDLGDSLFRGDITDLLMSFASPNGTTLNLFIDNVDAGVKNNLTQQDASTTGRNFDFLVALKIALNNNIRNAATNKIVVFYSDFDEVASNGDEFGTTGAVIVQDSASADMVAADSTAAEVTFEYVHPGVGDDYVVTIVCIADTTGQYVQTTSTLTRTNEVTASLVAGLERNYSNPS